MNALLLTASQGQWDSDEISAFADVYESVLSSDCSSEDEEESISKNKSLEVPQDKKVVDVSKLKSSAERNLFSQRHEIWRKYQVKTPRLATKSEEDWVDKYKPKDLNEFESKVNANAVETLREIQEDRWQQPVLLTGLSGAGKRSLGLLFLEMKTSASSRILQFTIHKDTEIREMLDPMLRKKKQGYALIAGLSRLSGRAQNSLWALLNRYASSYSFVLTAFCRTDLVEKILTGCTMIPTVERPSECIALEMVLKIALNEKVGYDREGIRNLFSHFDDNQNCGIDLGKLIHAFQRVFCARHYVSAENVSREFKSSLTTPLTIPASAALVGDPRFDRCSKCTLKPPCAHITKEMLAERGMQRRIELPQRNDAMHCECFLRTGACRFFNKTGRCALHHPLAAHTVLKPPITCRACTLTWPCTSCPYSVYRRALISAIAEVRSWQTRHNTKIPEALCAQLTELDQTLLKKLDYFIQTSLSTKESDFRSRIMTLQLKMTGIIAQFQDRKEAAEDTNNLPTPPSFITASANILCV